MKLPSEANVLVILPTHSRNSTGSLSRSIESVLSQSYKNFQLVVIDDASSDGSEQTIKNFIAQDSRVSTLRLNKNIGLPAWTGALVAAQIDYKFLAWAFDDSRWKTNHLEKLSAALESNPSSGVAYGKANLHFRGRIRQLGGPLDKEKLKKFNYIANCSTLIRRDLIDLIGWFDPNIIMKRINDWDFWVRASEKTEFAFVNEVIADEFGPDLTDSLGRSVVLFPDLVHKRMSISREQWLKVENLAYKELYTPRFEMNPIEQGKLNYAIVEHLARIQSLESINEWVHVDGREPDSAKIEINQIALQQAIKGVLSTANVANNSLTRYQQMAVDILAQGLFALEAVTSIMKKIKSKILAKKGS